MNKILNFDAVIYHSPCNDGACALWAANYYKKIKEKIPCKAGFLPNLTPNNKNILFVDICPNFEYLFEISKLAKNIVIIDHHKTSLDDFEINKLSLPTNLHFVLDKDRAGCQIVWDYFHESQRPWFIDYVADRDLWVWKLPNSKEITQVFFENNMLNPYCLDNIDKLLMYTDDQIKDLAKEGEILLKYQKKQIDMACSKASKAFMIVENKTYNVWVATMTYGDRSQLGNMLANKPFPDTLTLPDFSATWLYDQKSKEWRISLRSVKNHIDLTKIAKFYGGGGHANAVSFCIKYPKSLNDVFII
jgi:oligoribonuclease NrnB/cAMP/cGMP phosphodiesterase (DHH superfamily)